MMRLVKYDLKTSVFLLMVRCLDMINDITGDSNGTIDDEIFTLMETLPRKSFSDDAIKQFQSNRIGEKLQHFVLNSSFRDE
jgi:hypothetical protein